MKFKNTLKLSLVLPFLMLSLLSFKLLAQTTMIPDSLTKAYDKVLPPRYLPKKLSCSGKYQTPICNTWFYLNQCENWIQVRWEPLKKPGNLAWANKHQTYCSVLYASQNKYEERKLQPKQCTLLHQFFSKAVLTFPEIPVEWQSQPKIKWVVQNKKNKTPCAYQTFEDSGKRDGVLYSKEVNSSGSLNTEFALGLTEVANCRFEHKKKKRVVTCPVLPPNIEQWLRKFFQYLKVELVIKNEPK